MKIITKLLLINIILLTGCDSTNTKYNKPKNLVDIVSFIKKTDLQISDLKNKVKKIKTTEYEFIKKLEWWRAVCLA